MKNRSSIWLLLSTLVLCLGVMTFGVYSVLSGTLHINGTLGFNMHNATVTVSGTIQNVAMTTDNWATATRETITIERTVMGGEDTTTTNLSLGELYFHAGYNMIFEFTFTNISEKAIQATFPLPTVGNGVTLLTGTENGYTDFKANSYTTKIAKKSSKTVSFALTMETQIEGTNVEFLWSDISFEEYEEYKIDEKGRLFTYLGDYNGAHLKWYAIAKDDNGTYKTLKSTKFTSVQPGNYIFISEYVLDNGGTRKDFSSSDLGVYNGSPLQVFVNEITQDNSIYKLYNFGKDEYAEVYDNIMPYNCVADAGTFEGSAGGQRLWVLSQSEFTSWLGDSENELTVAKWLSTKADAYWFLRSFQGRADWDDDGVGEVIQMYFVDYSGSCSYNAINAGARPVFQINIS